MMLADFTFIRPLWLLALLPLGGLLWYWWRSPGRDEARWRGLIDAHLLPHLLVDASSVKKPAMLALLGASGLVAVLALTGPAMEQATQTRYQRDVTRVLVLELTSATAAQLEQVKVKLYALLKALPDGQTALLVYGGEPYLVVPPTTDVETISLFVPDLAVDVIPVPGNRPERALRMAVDILQRNTSGQQEVLWITAGAGGNPLPLAELGATRLSILQLSAAVDPLLEAAAISTGGVVVRLRADNADVIQLAHAMQARSGWAGGNDVTKATAVDMGYWLLLPLLPLGAWVFRRGILALILVPMLLTGLVMPRPALAQDLSWPAMWADYQGWRLLQSGQPQTAVPLFSDPRWLAAAHYRAGNFGQAASLFARGTDADSHYNRGNALAKQGQLTDALAAYEVALQLRPGDADIRFNRDLVQRLLNPPPQPPKGGAGTPPPPDGEAEREAARVAEQWLRGIPDQPGSLLRRKLLAEQKRREAGPVGGRAW